jgi:3-deoxy-D-manno-octulosonate 8-phosphate phosphatase (KDO 8-P phosphatase)
MFVPKYLKRKFLLRKIEARTKPLLIIVDVDGVLTDGNFLYSANGKEFKRFGAYDSDGLRILEKFCKINFISADKRGFEISNCRITDMGATLQLVSAGARARYVENLAVNYFVIFVADSFTDIEGMRFADVSVVPSSGHRIARNFASYVLETEGGAGVLAELAFIIGKPNVMRQMHE